jgi:hypothetical protein
MLQPENSCQRSTYLHATASRLIFEESVKASPSPPIPEFWSVNPFAVRSSSAESVVVDPSPVRSSSRGKVIANPPMVSKSGYELSKRSIPAATPWSTSSGREKPLTWRGLDVGSFSCDRGFLGLRILRDCRFGGFLCIWGYTDTLPARQRTQKICSRNKGHKVGKVAGDVSVFGGTKLVV